MIASISGVLKSKSTVQAIVEVNGIGYSLNVSNLTISKIGNIGESVSFYTELQIKDDKIFMYGFLTLSELNMFNLLQSIQGIGPKASLSILSSLDVDQIVLGITSSDKSVFLKADGIGSRVATRIISELNEKINSFNFGRDEIEVGNRNLDKQKDNLDMSNSKTIVDDSISAIVNLGYTRSEAYKAVINARNEILNSEEKTNISIEKLVPLALKNMTG